jgi:transcriptional regulator with XRE-family HTH domain
MVTVGEADGSCDRGTPRGWCVVLVADSTFGRRLRELREKAGLSRYALAKVSGVTAQALANLENGSSVPTWPTVLKLARALDVSVEEFDTGEDPRDRGDQAGDEPPPATPAKRPKKPKPKK